MHPELRARYRGGLPRTGQTARPVPLGDKTSRRRSLGGSSLRRCQSFHRGPKIREVLETVRGMVDTGRALAILGNHEVNAMRYAAIGSDGQPLRPHISTNTKQHQATLDQFPDPREWAGWIVWFAGLPLSLDLVGLRAVHACWDAEAIRELAGIGFSAFTSSTKSTAATTPKEASWRISTSQIAMRSRSA